MKKIVLTLVFAFYIFSLKSQNTECIGNPINIPLTGYKAGNIQWQFSKDAVNWINLIGKNTANLQYNIIETGYFRAKVTYGKCEYYSDTTFITAYTLPTVAMAGNDTIMLSGDTILFLKGNSAEIGDGVWTIVSGNNGMFENDKSPVTKFTGISGQKYTLKWTISNECYQTSDTVSILFQPLLDFNGTKLMIFPWDLGVHVNWGPWNVLITEGNGANSLTDGAANTNAIVTQAGTTNYGANICSSLDSLGYNDWYLPAKDELNAIYLNKTQYGQFTAFAYWSSTQYSQSGAWAQSFSNGNQSNLYKQTPDHKVRCVRKK